MATTFDPSSLPPWPPSTGLKKHFNLSFSFQQLLRRASSGLTALPPDEEILDSLCNIAQMVESGVGGAQPLFIAQDAAETMSIAFQVISAVRVAPDVMASYGGGSDAAAQALLGFPEERQPSPGPLIPVAYLISSPASDDEARVRACAASVARLRGTAGSIKVSATTLELPLLAALLRASSARVSVDAHAAYERDGRPLWTLGWLGVQSPAADALARPSDTLRLACCGVGCSVEGAKLRCAGCKGVVYCSTACQRSAWATHRQVCAREDKARSAVAGGSAKQEAV